MTEPISAANSSSEVNNPVTERVPGPAEAFISERPRTMLLIGSLALLLISLVAFSRTFGSQFIWDDNKYVTENLNLRTLDGMQKIWREPSHQTQYYPLVLTTFWIEYHLWGLNPIGYHVDNVLVHALSAILLWIILRRLAVPAAWVAAALFAVHPLQVESVAWVAERKNVLSGMFYLLSLMVYLRYCKIMPAEPWLKVNEDDVEPWYRLPADPTRVYALAIFLFACALFSKTVTATLPVAILLIIWWKRGRLTLADFTPLIPMFVIGLALGSFTGYHEAHVIGAQGETWHLAATKAGDIAVRCMIAGRAVWFYALKLFVPVPLNFNYARWVLSPGDWVQFVFPISVLLILLALWLRRKRIGRGPLACVAFFVVTLLPALCFVNFYPMRYSFVADHFQYLAGIGLIVLTVGGLKQISDRLVRKDLLHPFAAPVAGGIVVVLCGIGTIAHSGIFYNLQTLWEDTLDKTNQKSWMAANNYGVWLRDEGKIIEADAWFHKALRLNPHNAESLYNLGRMALLKKQEAEAISLFEQSLAEDPPYRPAEFDLAQAYIRANRIDDAFTIAQRLTQDHPDSPEAHGTLGMLLGRRGLVVDAAREYQRALELAPDTAITHFNFASALMRVGKPADALAEFAIAASGDPNNPNYINGFGTAEDATGNRLAAEKLFIQATRVDPKFVDAYINLGLLYQTQMKLHESQAALQKALEIDPKSESAASALKNTQEWIADPSKRPSTQSSTQPATRAAIPSF